MVSLDLAGKYSEYEVMQAEVTKQCRHLLRHRNIHTDKS